MGNLKSDQKNTRKYGLKLSKNTDADIIDQLDRQRSVQGYIKALVRNDMMKGDKTMKRISIDNGHSYVEPKEAIEGMDWDTIVNLMDDETREAVHDELAPCSDLEFLTRYLELAPDDLIIG